MVWTALFWRTALVNNNSGCVLLPFTPQLGCIYYMTASLTVPASMGNWVAMGFAQFNTQTNNGGYSRFADNPPNGYAWMYAQVGNLGSLVWRAERTEIKQPPLPSSCPARELIPWR